MIIPCREMRQCNLSAKRMKELSEQASWYAHRYCPKPPILPQEIAAQLSISHTLGNFEGCFDGALDYKPDEGFHVFLHVSGNDNLYTPRVRFSYGHKLAHNIIDEHRNSIRKHTLPIHGSLAALDSDVEIEREADMFSACLLMPEEMIAQDIYRRKFNFALIDEISRKYQVSITAAMLRFIALGNHPVMVVCSKTGRLKWLRYSDDFPYKRLNLGANYQIPCNTCAGEYFMEGRKYPGTTETVFPEDWFVLYNSAQQR